jgi:nucleoside-diphosphate-sugar epimerase
VRKQVVLVTGAAGEMGQALITRLSAEGRAILALDVNALPESIRARAQVTMSGDILDERLLSRLVTEFEIPLVYHLAAVLSTRAEYSLEAAHMVNVDGTLALLRLAVEQGSWLGHPVTFVFPSSIAAYGLPDLATKARAGAVKEHEWNVPTTMYGCNKLYCEHLGRYYARHYRQLAAGATETHVDFRSIRFPGLISAFTLPTGGTSDYAPEMLHEAAQGQPYSCFVREDTRIPFMAMPDAVEALIRLQQAPRESLTAHVYNITSFNPTAGDLRALTLKAFPGARVDFAPDPQRQAIVDSWPGDLDDSRARRDWGFQPSYDLERAFDHYLVPNIRARYAGERRPES